jgi:hypothetical protein
VLRQPDSDFHSRRASGGPRGEKLDWKVLTPSISHLMSPGGGGSRDWSTPGVKYFVGMYHRKITEAGEGKAQAELALAVANVVAMMALLTPTRRRE